MKVNFNTKQTNKIIQNMINDWTAYEGETKKYKDMRIKLIRTLKRSIGSNMIRRKFKLLKLNEIYNYD